MCVWGGGSGAGGDGGTAAATLPAQPATAFPFSVAAASAHTPLTTTNTTQQETWKAVRRKVTGSVPHDLKDSISNATVAGWMVRSLAHGNTPQAERGKDSICTGWRAAVNARGDHGGANTPQ